MATASRWVRLRTILGWPAGIALVSWRYMWRTTPLHRSDEAGSAEDLPDQPPQDDGDGRQGLDAGVGPMLHRSYAVRIVNSTMSPAALIDIDIRKLTRGATQMTHLCWQEDLNENVALRAALYHEVTAEGVLRQ